MKIDLVALLLAMVLGFIFIPKLIDLLNKTILVSKNYRGDSIPNGMGLAFLFALSLSLGTFIIQDFIELDKTNLLIYLLGLVFIGLLGLVDDLLGDDTYKGFKGHIGAFFKGELTTGNIKASLGFFISLVISSFYSEGLYILLLNTLILALFINLMNLFDLRPGRAVKVFILISLALLLSMRNSNLNIIILSIYGILIPYMKYDLKALVMMGDTGSNPLGYSLGFYAINSQNNILKLSILIMLLVIHLVAEKRSISEIIKNNKILNYIDMLGR